LLADLATLARNTIITAINPNHPIIVLTKPTPLQHKAFALLPRLRGFAPLNNHFRPAGCR
jgi:hypothetical protein